PGTTSTEYPRAPTGAGARPRAVSPAAVPTAATAASTPAAVTPRGALRPLAGRGVLCPLDQLLRLDDRAVLMLADELEPDPAAGLVDLLDEDSSEERRVGEEERVGRWTDTERVT